MAAEHAVEQSGAAFIKHHMTNLKIGEGFWAFHIDTLVFSVLLGIVLCWVMKKMAEKSLAQAKKDELPSFGVIVAEMIFEFVDNTVKGFYGHSRGDIGSLALTIFCWVFLWNTMDMIPVDFLPGVAGQFGIHYLKVVPSTDVNSTFALSIFIMVLTYIYLFKNNHGVKGFCSAMVGHPFEAHKLWSKCILYPINLLLKIIEDLAKVISLSLRLYGNLFAGELVFVLIALLPWFIQFVPGGAWAIFHILVVTLQAYLFMILSIVYLSMTEQHH